MSPAKAAAASAGLSETRKLARKKRPPQRHSIRQSSTAYAQRKKYRFGVVRWRVEWQTKEEARFGEKCRAKARTDRRDIDPGEQVASGVGGRAEKRVRRVRCRIRPVLLTCRSV